MFRLQFHSFCFLHAAIPNAPPPETLRLQLRTDWFKTSLPPLPSPLPKKHTFDQPLLLSNLQLVPMETVSGDATQTKPNLNVRAQLQVYGNKKGVCVCVCVCVCV